MNGKQLRNSILQWAISGRLVPQCPTDEPAIELLKRINPKAAPLAPDDVPFTLPDSWCWCKVKDIAKSISYGVSESAKPSGKYRLLRITDIQGNKVDWDSVPYTDYDEKKATSYLLQNDDILFARTGATVGKSYIVTGLTQPSIYASYLIRIQTHKGIYPQYVKSFFESSYYWKQITDNSVGTGQPNVNGTILGSLLIPLPPLAEQERIVRKVEELLPLVERYDKAQTELDHLNASLKGKLRASVLQEAISGRLVPQDPNDEPAIALLRRINPNFTPQPTDEPLPPGWTACTLEDIVEIKDNLRQPINSAERNKRVAGKKDSELYPYYGATGQVGYIDKYLIDGKYLLLGEDGAPFLDKMANKAYIVEGKCWVNNHAHVLLPHCNTEYLCLYLNQFSYYSYVTGSTRLKLTQASMKKMPVLVPPLAEQERIVGKVEDLFAVLDSLQ